MSVPVRGVQRKVPARLRRLGIGLLWAFPMLVLEGVLLSGELAEEPVLVLVELEQEQVLELERVLERELELVLEQVLEQVLERFLELEQERSQVLEQEQYQVLEGRGLVQRQSWAV